ncbi:hypothetical protein [Serratia sp. Ag2]|uniref:hypothetical protein n=1 Tax=Serratia sp. Ag2 TaxID=1532556 RepID=UPI000A91BCED|nr:hypothetical protein [Serratia sp. Ag2]
MADIKYRDAGLIIATDEAVKLPAIAKHLSFCVNDINTQIQNYPEPNTYGQIKQPD